MENLELVKYTPCLPALLGGQQGQREHKGEKMEWVSLISVHCFCRQPANQDLATY